MSWKEVTPMSQKLEFVMLALQEHINFSKLCEQFEISRKTGYKILKRYVEQGEPGLLDRSRRPHSSPNNTPKEIEGLILKLRQRHPVWGARKLKRRLQDLGYKNLPAVSTITAILKRHERIAAEISQKHKKWKRFCATAPNELWQMDFKGHFPAKEGDCHPLTLLDDHSRYCLCLAACHNEQKQTVKHHLTRIFGSYGIPNTMLMDNGAPWGGDAEHPYTELTVWLLRLGIKVIHSHPYHPQTIGKEERFHRTLKAEVIADCMGEKHHVCQRIFDRWRLVYNTQRPHESLDMDVPAHYYRPAQRSFPQSLPEIEYLPGDEIRKVQEKGIISYKNINFKVGKAFRRQTVAIRPASTNGIYNVFFCHEKIAQIKFP